MEWNEKSLQALIDNGAMESVELEFKAGPALYPNGNKEWIAEICKDVSAFANSAGGTIIYGIKEKDHKAAEFSFVDAGKMDRERLESILLHGIQRRIPDLKIIQVIFVGKLEESVFVIEIPQSRQGPHMVRNMYYKRFNFMAVPMEEYEVRDVMNRESNIQLKILPIIKHPRHRGIYGKGHFNNFKLRLQNIGHVTAKGYSIEVEVTHERSERVDLHEHYKGMFIMENDDALTRHIFRSDHPVSIFPGYDATVFEFIAGVNLIKPLTATITVFASSGVIKEVQTV